MMNEVSCLDFTGQHLFVGIDVHKKQWTITIRLNGVELKTFSMNPDPAELHGYLHKHYPGALYHSVYEAGFCGFWIHRELLDLGIDNMIVNPADVPSTSKERDQKRDPIDSRKLARELANGSLTPIYVPDEFHEHLRALCRLRRRQSQHQTRLKNRIKSYLAIQGIKLPENCECQHWSKAFINWLSSLSDKSPLAKAYLDISINALLQERARLADTLRRLRNYSRQKENRHLIHDCLCSVSGVGFITAITLYSEIIDIKRFANLDRMKSFFGLIPSVASSDETHLKKGLTHRRNAYLRHLIIESAWVAIRKDPALTMAFNQLCRRMTKQDAIIRIAKKLVNRIRYVWINQTPYSIGIIQ